MIKFLNGRKISSIVISTALGFDGTGMFPYVFSPDYQSLLRIVQSKGIMIFPKSSTFNRKKGNFILLDPRTWKYIRRLPSMSMVNAYGLTNEGVQCNARKIADACASGSKVIPNFYPEFFKGLEAAIAETLTAIMIYRFKMGDNFWALELDVSCLNSQEKIAENMKQVIMLIEALKKNYPWLVLIVKTSIVHPMSFYQELENVGADVIHAINTIPWDFVFSEKISPLHSVGGGSVSGEVTFPLAYECIQRICQVTDLPKIFGCGISNTIRARKLFVLGKHEKVSISICTAFLRDSKEAEKILNLN
jgi:dihydroorotate dehydrogenase